MAVKPTGSYCLHDTPCSVCGQPARDAWTYPGVTKIRHTKGQPSCEAPNPTSTGKEKR